MILPQIVLPRPSHQSSGLSCSNMHLHLKDELRVRRSFRLSSASRASPAGTCCLSSHGSMTCEYSTSALQAPTMYIFDEYNAISGAIPCPHRSGHTSLRDSTHTKISAPSNKHLLNVSFKSPRYGTSGFASQDHRREIAGKHGRCPMFGCHQHHPKHEYPAQRLTQLSSRTCTLTDRRLYFPRDFHEHER